MSASHGTKGQKHRADNLQLSSLQLHTNLPFGLGMELGSSVFSTVHIWLTASLRNGIWVLCQFIWYFKMHFSIVYEHLTDIINTSHPSFLVHWLHLSNLQTYMRRINREILRLRVKKMQTHIIYTQSVVTRAGDVTRDKNARRTQAWEVN